MSQPLVVGAGSIDIVPLTQPGAVSTIPSPREVRSELEKQLERSLPRKRLGIFLLAAGTATTIGVAAFVAIFSATILATPIGWGIVAGLGGAALLAGIIGTALILTHSREKLKDILTSTLCGTVLAVTTLVAAIPLAWSIILLSVGSSGGLEALGAIIYAFVIFPVLALIFGTGTVVGAAGGVVAGVEIAQARGWSSRPEQKLPELTQSQNPTEEFKTEVKGILKTRKNLVEQEVPAIEDAEVNLEQVFRYIKHGQYKKAYSPLLKLYTDEANEGKKLEYALTLSALTIRIGEGISRKSFYEAQKNKASIVLLEEMRKKGVDSHPALAYYYRFLNKSSAESEKLISLQYAVRKENFHKLCPGWKREELERKHQIKVAQLQGQPQE